LRGLSFFASKTQSNNCRRARKTSLYRAYTVGKREILVAWILLRPRRFLTPSVVKSLYLFVFIYLYRASAHSRDIDIAILPVRLSVRPSVINTLVLYENGLKNISS